jgi:hypothetical protein
MKKTDDKNTGTVYFMPLNLRIDFWPIIFVSSWANCPIVALVASKPFGSLLLTLPGLKHLPLDWLGGLSVAHPDKLRLQNYRGHLWNRIKYTMTFNAIAYRCMLYTILRSRII